MSDRGFPVGVIGAGAMGRGIAQVAASAGHSVLLADANADAVSQARAAIGKALDRDVEKQRRTRAEADEVLARIVDAGDVRHGHESFRGCGLVIEAVVERLEVKQALFTALEAVVGPHAVLATNTSSLSVAAIAGACKRPGRVIGIHFFNPAPVMPLVEVVPAITTEPVVTERMTSLVSGWGKTTVVATDTPGFIVNRVARPFYGESLRQLEEGIADVATIDWAMRELGGFRMGPFELMDFIGNDVNYAVTRSVFESMYFDSRYSPALTQQRMVEAGLYGRKRERGYYDYRDGATRPEPTMDETLGRGILDRTLALLINEAVDAVHHRVASPAAIETAMTRGVNYPRGLLAWGDEIGAATILHRLEALQDDYGEDRYRASVLLRRCVRERRPLLS